MNKNTTTARESIFDTLCAGLRPEIVSASLSWIKLPKLFLSFFLWVVVLAFPVRADAAVRVYFDPTTISVAQNNEFTVQLKIDAETNQVVGSDAVVSYAAADLEVMTVTTGGYFPQFTNANDATAGKLELHGYVTSTYQSKTGAGTLATVKFKSKKGSGSSAISFTCNGSGNDTNILSISGQNLLTCSQVNTVAVSYTGGSGNPTATPTPTTPIGGGNPTSTPTPTQAASGGNTIPYCSTLTASTTSATGTPLTVTLTCSGVDPGGDITAADFIFGDGTSQLVQKNVGSPGSITTTHTYTTIGTLGVSCRVRDNDNTYSSNPTPGSCKQIITIRPATSGGNGTSGTQITGTITPTPTTPVLAIISDTPEPTYAATPSPILYPEDDTLEEESNNFWWIAGGAGALILAFLLLRRRHVPPQVPPQQPPSAPPVVPPGSPQQPGY
jgi:hypothetical protein